MRGMIESRHYLNQTGTCDDCGVMVNVKPAVDWTVNNTQGRASGTVEEATVGLRYIISQLVGVLPNVVDIQEVTPTPDGLVVQARLGSHQGGVLLDAMTITTRYTNINEPKDCSYEADVCIHGSKVGGWCYKCPDHKAEDMQVIELPQSVTEA